MPAEQQHRSAHRRPTQNQHDHREPLRCVADRTDADARLHDIPGLTRPRVRLASSSMDEGMFSVLVRLDELLRVREQCGDTYVLDRIQDLYTTRFRDLGL